MAHAEKCPVCNGSGKRYKFDPNGTTDKPAGFQEDGPCYGCGGLGWVTVQDQALDSGVTMEISRCFRPYGV